MGVSILFFAATLTDALSLDFFRIIESKLIIVRFRTIHLLRVGRAEVSGISVGVYRK